jgi:hypothetical protein
VRKGSNEVDCFTRSVNLYAGGAHRKEEGDEASILPQERMRNTQSHNELRKSGPDFRPN